MILLHIDEEYGYKEWHAFVTEERYATLYEQFQLKRPDINCLMDVRALIPEAVQGSENFYTLNGKKFYFATSLADKTPVSEDDVTVRWAHIHESDDSYMQSPELA